MKRSILFLLLFTIFTRSSSFGCDGLVPVVSSNSYIGNGQYLLTIEFCETVSNGVLVNGNLLNNANIFGLVFTVNGANIIGINTPSLTGVTSGLTIFPTQTAANQVEYGDWGNPAAPVLLEYGDPQECWTVQFVVDNAAVSVNVGGSTYVGAAQPGAGMVNSGGLWHCSEVITIPPVTCNSSWTPPLFCVGSTTPIDLDATTAYTGVFSGPGVNSATGIYTPTGLPGPVSITFTVGDAFLNCSTTQNVTPVSLTPPTLTNQTVCPGTPVNLDATVTIAGGCTYTLVLTDSWGDGWNGADVDIYINGVAYLMNQTVANCGSGPCTNTLSIPVNSGDIILLNYTGGTYDNENTITLYNSSMTQVSTINDPPNGNLGAGITANCPSGPLVYSWSPAAGLSNPNIANPVATPAVTTTYTVTITSAALGCSASTPVTITVAPCPPVTLCNSGTGLVASGGNGSFTWYYEAAVIGSTPITNAAECISCGGTPSYLFGIIYTGCSLANCPSVTYVWTQYATGVNAPYPPNYPIQVVDGMGTDVTYATLASIPMCNTCVPPVLVLDNQTVCSPMTVDLNSTINAASGVGNATFYATLANANSATSPIGAVVAVSGVYYVRYQDPLDPTCFTVGAVTITITPSVTPTFAAVAPICSGAALAALPTTSTNGINGTWSPAINNMATTIYTFTPTAGQCAITTTLTISVGPPATPTFTAVTPICSGDPLAALPTISNNGFNGTWSPAINNTATTLYTFTPTVGQCATTTTLTITVNSTVTPTFTAVAPICAGSPLAALPTISNNGINGAWSPAINNSATTLYTFTPTVGQCATTTTLTITVNPSVTPTFAVVAPICSGDALTPLPTTSTNGINGTWSPALNNTATTLYTFTPIAGQCATTTTLTISVGPPATPTFTAVTPICSGDPLAALPTISNNGFNGTWSPAINNTATTLYTFTPTVGQCATTTTLTITVNPTVIPTFTAVAPICSGDPLAALPTTSMNGINGTWSPAINNTATTVYTFTPTAGQCATTTTLTITVNPLFTSVQNVSLCAGSNYTYPDGTTSSNILVNESQTSILTSINGCDSTIVTNITINNVITTNTNFQVCSGENFTYGDGTMSTNITVNESHTSSYVTAMGCDSLVTENVSVNPIYNIPVAVTLCENESITYPDGVVEIITASTTHTSNLTTALGCDSVIVTTVTMNPIYSTTENVSICENEQITYPDGVVAVITANTSHTSNLTSISGCDSTVITNVQMNPISQQSEDITLCYGSDYTYPDGTVSNNILVNETHTSILTTAFGCDSVIVTDVAIVPLPPANAGNDISICDGEFVTLDANDVQGNTVVWSGGVLDGVPFAPTATQTYTLTVTNNTGCQSTDAVTVTVNADPVASFIGDDLFGCEPHTVSFTNTSVGGPFTNCTWNLGNGTTVTDCGPFAYTYNQSGLYTVTLNVTNTSGCSASVQIVDYIEVVPQPNAAFTASELELDILDTEVSFNNNSSNADYYTWDFGDQSAMSNVVNPTHTYPDETAGYVITLIAYSNAGCSDTATMVIPVNDILIYYIPNTFTPDGDAFNQVFQPVFTSGYDPYDFNLFIFNRWGEIIWESHDASVGWDGKYGGELVQDGTYTWKIDFKTTMSDERIMGVGHVNVIR